MRPSHLARLTRPDIQFATFYAARYQRDPGIAHWKTTKRTMRYVKQTKHYKMEADPNRPFLEALCDSDWMQDPEKYASTSGYMICMKGIPILAKSRLQKLTAKSSTAAEIIALCDCVEEIVWVINLLEEIGYKTRPTIWVDNKPCIQTVERNQLTKGNKNLAMRYHFIKGYLRNERLRIRKISTEDNIADMLTKPLARNKLKTFASKVLNTSVNGNRT